MSEYCEDEISDESAYKRPVETLMADAQLHGGAYKKERIDAALAEFWGIKEKLEMGIACNFKTTDIYDKPVDTLVRALTKRPRLYYRSYQKMAKDGDTVPIRVCFGIDEQTPLPETCCDFEEQPDNMVAADAYWEKSAFCKTLTELLVENVDKMRAVKQVVCFGLGNLSTRQSSRSYIQHLAANKVTEVLTRHAERTPQIPVFVQDPNYCAKCIITLNQLGVEVVEDPKGFTLLDESTFVISISPNVCVRQIVADYTQFCGGPAGILCNPVEDNGLNPATYCGSPSSTDPSSINLIRYTEERCMRFELSDDGEKEEHVYFHDMQLFLKEK